MAAALPHTATPDRKPLRVLLVEDSVIDAGLIIRELENSGYDVDWQRVDTAAALRATLISQPWDVVLSDYTMPRFSGMEVLKIAKASGLDLPVIIISGAISDETAVETMRAGAQDYLLKDRLARLGLAVESALSEAEERRARRRAEDALRESERFARATLDSLSAHIAILDQTGTLLAVNRSWRAFAEENSPVAANVSEGANYLAVCDQALGASSEGAGEFAAGIRAVLSGELDYFEMEYPCHAPDEQRWFMGRVTRFPGEGPVCAVIAHENTTQIKLAELKLAAERRLLRTLIDSLPDHIYAKDAESRFIFRNETSAHLLGAASPDEMIGKTDFDYFPPELAAQYHAGDQAVIQSGQPLINWEEPIVDAEGNQGWVLTTKVPLLDERGKVIGLVGTGHDITARKRTMETLRESEEKYRTLFEESFDGLFITSLGGKILDMNKKGVAMFGYDTKEEILSLDLTRDIYAYPPDRQRILDMVNAQGTAEYEVVVKKKSGEQMVTHCALTAVKNQQGVITTYRGIIRDITERKQMENALQQERNLLRTLIDTLPDYIFVKDRQGRFVVSNLAHTQTVPQATQDSLIGKTSLELYPPERGQHFHTDDLWVMDSGEMLINAERQTYNPDGTQRWVLTTKVPLKDTDGQIVGLVGVSRDITERKRAEEALREHNRRLIALNRVGMALAETLTLPHTFQTAYEHVSQMVDCPCFGVSFYDSETQTLRAIFMLSDGGLLEADCFPPLVLNENSPLKGRARAILTQQPEIVTDMPTGPSEQTTVVGTSGDNRIPCSALYVPMVAQGRTIGLLEVRSYHQNAYGESDIALLGPVANQIALAIQNARLFADLETERNALEQRVIERTAQLNHAKERIEAILDSSSDIMVLCRADGTIDQVNPAFSEVFGTEPDEALRQPLTELVIPEHIPILEQALETAVGTRQSARVEVIVHYKGGVPFDADVVLSPVVEQDDQLLGVVCSLRNITERKQMEDQLRRTLEHEMALGELKSRYVAMAAHDLRNPLAVIQSSMGILRHYSDRLTDEQKQSNYDRVQTSIKVMVDMLNDILTIGQVESGTLRFDPAPLDLIAFCQNMVAEAQQATMAAQQISFFGQGACETAYPDAKLLRHILGNLLSNAIKYSLEASTVTLTVDCESDQITFRIQDQGIGIPRADQARLFEAFHRASNTGKVPGTGLGLVIVKQSVDLHGGTITFESGEGVGTTFTVILPQTPTEK